MIRILHTADWQLGKEFGAFDPMDAALLTEARVAVIKTIAELACEHQADVVTVGGDVFELNAVREKTIRQAFAATAGYPCPWAYIAGNHDPALPESAWTCAQRIGAVPPHVHLCLKPEPLVLLNGRLVILPAPLNQRTTHADATEWFDHVETPEGALRIGLAHGSVEGYLPEGAGRNNPIAADRAQRAHLDALLLGDWHGYLQVGDRTFYSGTPETDRFVDNQSGHVVLLEFDGRGPPRAKPIATGQYRWHTHQPLLAVSTDVDEAIAQLDAFGGNDVIQFRPTGQVTLGDNRRLREATARAQGRVRAFNSSLAELHITATDEDIDAMRADGYVARVIDRLRTEQNTAAAPADAALARESLVLLANLMDMRGQDGAAICD